MPLDADSVPRLWRLARIKFDHVRQQSVLLFPEGVLLLNDTGTVILELCDGRRPIKEIAAVLGERYHCDVLADVIEYLQQLADKEYIHDARSSDDAPR